MSEQAYFPAGDTPFWAAYYADRAAVRTSMAIPGHKLRTDLVGDVVAGDRPLILTRDLTLPSLGTLALAEQKTARLWGAELARFSVNGSTACNLAAMTAVARPGDKVVISRTLHKSLLFGLINAGAVPIWVTPRVDRDTGLPMGVDPADITAALTAHPDAIAVFTGEPSYVGTFGDIAGQAAAAHAFGVPLIVDAAWAAHFGFHPDLPAHAITAGADMMVTSMHKTLPAHTQAAILLATGDRIDLERVNRVFDGTQTTSPAGSILASMDAARAVLQHSGPELLGPVLAELAITRVELEEVEGVRVLQGPHVDPMKLVILLHQSTVNGQQVEAELLTRGIDVEAADRDLLIPQPTLADRPSDIRTLTDVLIAQLSTGSAIPAPTVPSTAWSVQPVMRLSPRDAFNAPVTTVGWDDAEGRVAGELIAPYPPGIPVVTPGEEITSDVLGILQAARDAGVTIAYAADPTLATIRVLAN